MELSVFHILESDLKPEPIKTNRLVLPLTGTHFRKWMRIARMHPSHSERLSQACAAGGQTTTPSPVGKTQCAPNTVEVPRRAFVALVLGHGSHLDQGGQVLFATPHKSSVLGLYLRTSDNVFSSLYIVLRT